MKVLVYGPGALGSYLAHVLLRGGNDVTVLARGKRIEELNKDGLVIRHYFQRKTTVDRVNVIDTLRADDVYDIIFVVMLYSDFQAVLPALADNQSSHIVLVGNNADTHGMQKYLEENSQTPKQVAFGFQTTGGLRENGRIVCVRGGAGGMAVGGLDAGFTWRNLLEKAFANTSYKLTFYDNIDPWLKSHIVPVLVLSYAACIYDGDLRKVTRDKKLRHQIIGAMDEGFKVLETLGYTITPAGQAQFIRKRRQLTSLLLRVYTATPVSRIVDPLANMSEVFALHHAFDELKQKAHILTPNWDILEGYIR